MSENKLSFEEAMARLEALVLQLEKEKKPLDEALQIYEECVKLAAVCVDELDVAKRRIQILQQGSNGEIGVVDVPEGTFTE
jgi:exodeoxyribonuclease VII small subunit